MKAWALATLKDLLLSNPEGNVQETKVPSELMWSVSWAARMLMLSRGYICESKQEALQWLANEYAEIRSLVTILIDGYVKPDMAEISSQGSILLRRYCLRCGNLEKRLQDLDLSV